jgi:hypothetical protein
MALLVKTEETDLPTTKFPEVRELSIRPKFLAWKIALAC